MRLEYYMTKVLKKDQFLLLVAHCCILKQSLSQCLTSGNLHFKTGKRSSLYLFTFYKK